MNVTGMGSDMGGLDAVKAASWDLHRQAERSGIVADIMRRRAGRVGIVLWLGNLLPVYQALDTSPLGHPVLSRSAAIAADLQALSGGGLPPLLAEGATYAERIRELVRVAKGARSPELLAHAYVRYVGDVSGGLIMGSRMVDCLGGAVAALCCAEYGQVQDLSAFRREYRAALNDAVTPATLERVQSEACVAFRLTIALSDAVKRHADHSLHVRSENAAEAG